jgi:hypothetical protein
LVEKGFGFEPVLLEYLNIYDKLSMLSDELVSKINASIELGKKLCITSDQFSMIVDYQLMDPEQDRNIVAEVADRLLSKYNIVSWSFDKGFWKKRTRNCCNWKYPRSSSPNLESVTKTRSRKNTAHRLKS